jgi:hypothetical protein
MQRSLMGLNIIISAPNCYLTQEEEAEALDSGLVNSYWQAPFVFEPEDQFCLDLFRKHKTSPTRYKSVIIMELIR